MRTETLKKISMQLGRDKHSNKLKSLEESYKLLYTHILSKLKPKTWKQVKHIYKSQWDQNSNKKSLNNNN